MYARRATFTALLLASVADGGAFFIPAEAQVVPTAAGDRIEAANASDILVTARRREERQQEVPVAITALSGVQLEAKGIQDISGLRFATPSLQIAPSSFGPTVPGYTIRGQRLTEQLISQDPSVGVYFADVAEQRPHGTTQQLYDLESVEVLKGPQGTLFGRNTTGGAVLINPKKPVLDRFEGYITGVGGNYGLHGADGAINVPVGEDLAVRASGQVRYHNGYGHNLTTGRDTDDENMESFRLGALFQRGDLSSYTVATYLNYKDHGSASSVVTIAPGSLAATLFPGAVAALARQRARDPLIVENDGALLDETKAWSISNTTSLKLAADSLSVKNIMGYRKVKNRFQGDFDGTSFPIFNTADYLDERQFSEELQLLGNTMDRRLSYIAGAYFFREAGEDDQPSNTLGGLLASREGYAINKSYSLFAQADYNLTHRLTLTGGIRQTWDKRFLDIHGKTSVVGAPLSVCREFVSDTNLTPRNPCSLPVSATFDAFTYLATASYKFSPDVMAYATYNTGYRAGGINLRATRPAETAPYKPEDVKNYEVGIKSDLFGRLLHFNGAAYFSDYKNIQRTITRTCPGSTALCTNVENAASAHVKGFEFEAALHPVKGITIGGFAGYTDARYKRFISASGADISGYRFSFLPKWTYGVNGEIDVPVGGNMIAATVEYYHQTNMQTADLNDTTPLPGYSLVNASLAMRNAFKSNVDVRLFMNNVANKRYYEPGTDLVSSFGTNTYFVGEPRTFGGSMTVHF